MQHFSEPYEMSARGKQFLFIIALVTILIIEFTMEVVSLALLHYVAPLARM